jgi:outer membrane protein OmpA-like peptidoglycan-associated protein
MTHFAKRAGDLRYAVILNAHRFFLAPVFVAAALLLSQPSLAQDSAPAAGGSAPNIEAADCPPLPSFPQLAGSVVVSCQRGDSTAVTMLLAPDAHGSARERSVRGFYEYREYRIPHAEQAEHAFDDLLRLVPIAGFIVKYSISPSIITARNGDTWALINIGGDFYNLSVVREVLEPWTPVKTSAEIAREMQAHTRVNIYGIQFSPENQAIQEKQSPILDEVLKYLQQNADVAVIIESHRVTPNGSPQSDLEITAARSRAVAAWLTAHGVSLARLHSKPYGRTQPLGENDTPLEIARNERIVLARASK